MLIHSLLVAHIAVLGYWLGSELVINSTYRHVSCASGLPLAQRNELMDHVMHVDQHVRYALVLQFSLGFILLFLLAYLPGGQGAALAVAIFGVAWLVWVELAHRLRKSPAGNRLAQLDRAFRYVLMLGLVGLSSLVWLDRLQLPDWLAWKLVCFAAVMACGVAIRLVLVQLFRVWARLPQSGENVDVEGKIRSIYKQATAILGLLWLFIAIIVWLSITKPL